MCKVFAALGLVSLAAVFAATGCDKGGEAPAPKATGEKAQPAKDTPAKDAPAKADEAKAGDAVADAAAAKAKDLLKNSEAGKQLADLKDKGEQLKASLEDKAPPLTAERYEELILGLAPCELKERSIDSKCPQYEELKKAKQNKGSLFKDLVGLNSKLGRKHMANENATVRYYAVGLMGSGFANGVAKEDVQAIVKAGKKEKNPTVLARMVDVIGSSHGKSKAAGKWLLAMTRHKDERVRMTAISELSAWGKKLKGVVPAFKKVILKDKSPKVKAYACEQAGRLGAAPLLPVMQKLVKKKKTPKEIYAGCFKGIVGLWTGYPFPPEKPSRKAYMATLKLLKAKPRSDDRPPWTLVSHFKGLEKPKAEWVKKAKFFKKPVFFKAVATVVTDKKANWMARKGFIDLLVKMDAPKKVFEKMRKAYKKVEGSDSHVVKKLDEVIAAAQ